MKQQKVTAFDVITDFIIEKLEAGIIPWKKPWACANGEFNTFYNFISKKAYTGINPFILSTAMYEYSTPYFLTYKQCAKLKGQVKKGSKGYPICFFNWIVKEDEETGEKKKFPILKWFKVFNVEQCEGLDLSKLDEVKEQEELEFNSIDACEEIITNYQESPKVEHIGNRACYNSGTDKIKMPQRKHFNTEEEYYSTLFHEMVHSTGHDKRLSRKLGTGFGTDAYAKEELVAELGSCFLSSVAGIKEMVIDNQASYIDNWLKALKNDKKLIIYASAQAQKAVNHILGKKSEYETK